MSLEHELQERYADPAYHDGRMHGDNGWGYPVGGHWENLERWARSALGIVGAHLYLGREFPDRVLDLGCGWGTMTMSFGAYCVHAVGVDLSARFPYGAGRCVRANALALPFPDRTFHAVAALDIVEHLPLDCQGHLFAELRRVLRPGGRVYTTVPTLGKSHWLDTTAGPQHHYLTGSPEEWMAHFEAQGFQVVADGEDLALLGRPFDHGPDNYPFALRAEMES